MKSAIEKALHSEDGLPLTDENCSESKAKLFGFSKCSNGSAK
jgi:hypothetical protein